MINVVDEGESRCRGWIATRNQVSPALEAGRNLSEDLELYEKKNRSATIEQFESVTTIVGGLRHSIHASGYKPGGDDQVANCSVT